MHVLGSVFWWANLVQCGFSIVYWSLKGRYGTNVLPVILMPSGLTWIFQLMAVFIIRWVNWSPWNLIWCFPVSMVLGAIVAGSLERLILMRKIEQESPGQ